MTTSNDRNQHEPNSDTPLDAPNGATEPAAGGASESTANPEPDQTTEDNAAPAGIDPAYPLAGLPESERFIQHNDENHEDRRKMRRWLFAFIVLASALFLLLGALMSIYLTKEMVETKREVKGAMIKVVEDSSPESIHDLVFKANPIPPESVNHARETAKELSILASSQRNGLIDKFLETTNWLSLTPMITLIAFILGVGLTLAIALMRALFREEEEAEKSNTLSQIATPLSKLFEYLIEFVQKKFGRS
ncbi:hypothetical protein PO609_21515 [Enterobacter cloacae]|uniref:hypothetical protein n=1 Tax=Enterobacter cloacae TaxID=550 RepID=UPI002FFA97A7